VFKFSLKLFVLKLFLQNIEFRLRKMEESAEQILSHLGVIHRFMSTHTAGTDELRGSAMNIPAEMHRMRTISMSDNEGGGGSGGGGGSTGLAAGLGLSAALTLNSLQVRCQLSSCLLLVFQLFIHPPRR